MPPEAKVPPLKVDQRGASLVQGQERDMINRTYPHGVPCWIDTEQPDVEAATAFYGGIFGWTFEDAMPPGGPGRYLIARLAGKDVCAIEGPGRLPRRGALTLRSTRLMSRCTNWWPLAPPCVQPGRRARPRPGSRAHRSTRP